MIVAVLSALVLAPLPLHAQSVTFDVCDTGTTDIGVFVSRAGSVSSSHIRPSTCVAVAKSVGGGMEAAYLGIAFTDSRGPWGAARRFGNVPGMGVRELPLATRLAMSARGEPIPRSPGILTTTNRTASVRHGNATVTLPLQLLFQAPGPECRSIGTGNSFTTRTSRTETTVIEKTTNCEDVVYTLTVEPFADNREASLCWGQVGEIQIFLARQVRPVQSAQFAAGTQVWVPPVRYAPPRSPPPARADNDAAVQAFAKVVADDRKRRASSRLRNACIDQSNSAFAANPGNRDAINKGHAACIRRAGVETQKEVQRAEECAIQAMKATPNAQDATLTGSTETSTRAWAQPRPRRQQLLIRALRARCPSSRSLVGSPRIESS